MSGSPLVSVIVPSYNSAGFVVAAVRSALNQTYTNIEVIVVDDGSTDDTRAILAEFGDSIRYIHQANQGLPGARNTAIRAAKGSVFAFLDADDEWLPNKLAVQVPLLMQDERVALVHSDVTFLDVESGNRYQQYQPRERFQGNCYQALLFGNNVTPSTVIARASAVREAGDFDSSLVTGCEDHDLWLRLARHHSFAYTAEPLTVYRLHASNMTRNHLRMGQASLKVTRKALGADPKLRAAIGARRVDHHVADLEGSVGYLLLQSRQFRQAREHLWRGVRLDPRAIHLWRFWISSMLPDSFRRGFARLRNSTP